MTNKLFESEIEEIALDLLHDENGYERDPKGFVRYHAPYSETLKVSAVNDRYGQQDNLAIGHHYLPSRPLGFDNWNRENL